MPLARSSRAYREEDILIPLEPKDYHDARVEQIKVWLLMDFSHHRVRMAAHTNIQPEWRVDDAEINQCIEEAEGHMLSILDTKADKLRAIVLHRFSQAYSHALAGGDLRAAVDANDKFARYAGVSDKPPEPAKERPFEDVDDNTLAELIKEFVEAGHSGGAFAGVSVPLELAEGHSELCETPWDDPGQLAVGVPASGGTEALSFSESPEWEEHNDSDESHAYGVSQAWKPRAPAITLASSER